MFANQICFSQYTCIDSLFGTNGYATANITFSNAYSAWAMELASDNSIWYSGHYETIPGSNNLAPFLMHFSENGVHDTLLGNQGFITNSSFTSSLNVKDMTIHGNNIYICCQYGVTFPSSTLVLCYTISGNLNTTFGVNGIISSSFPYGPKHIRTQSNGKVILSGYGTGLNRTWVGRYNIDGSLDSSFATNGSFQTPTYISNQYDGLKIDSQDRILIPTSDGNNGDFTILRYTSNGVIDSSFSNDGKVGFGYNNNDVAVDVVEQLDGKLVVAGNSVNTTTGFNYFVITRVDSIGVLDNTFGTAGKTLINTTSGIVGTYPQIILTNQNKFIVPFENGDMIRLKSNGKLDSTFCSNGWANGAGRLGGLQSTGKIVTAQSAGVPYLKRHIGDFSVGLVESEGVESDELLINPNPSSSNITIESTTMILDLQVYDILGHQIFFNLINGKFFEWNCQMLNSGIYILKINTMNGIKTKRLFKL